MKGVVWSSALSENKGRTNSLGEWLSLNLSFLSHQVNQISIKIHQCDMILLQNCYAASKEQGI